MWRQWTDFSNSTVCTMQNYLYLPKLPLSGAKVCQGVENIIYVGKIRYSDDDVLLYSI